MRRVTAEEIVDFPWPGLDGPTRVGFAPAKGQLMLLSDPDGGIARRLYSLDPKSGERVLVFEPTVTEDEDLPLEEKLRRERLRERGKGVTRYGWSGDGRKLLVPLGTDAWVQEGLEGPAWLAASDAINPAFSPSGDRLAFVSGGEVVVAPVEGGAQTTLTSGEPGTTRGLAEYIAQEEMGRMEGFWWAPDGGSLAFVEVDERHIPAFRIVHQGKDTPSWEEHAYPFSGEENARVRLGVVPSGGGAPVWMDLAVEGERQDIYLARVRWSKDGALWAELQDRRQQRLELVRFDAETGERTVVLVETTEVWINLHRLFRPLKDGTFLWGSERSGFMHLYRYSRDGALLGELTSGPWMVETLEAVDEARGLVYFTGTLDSALEQHLYVVPLAGGAPVRLTGSAGMHAVTVSVSRGQFIDRTSSLTEQPSITLRALADGALLHTIHQAADPRATGLAPPELVEVTTRDGEPLHGALYRPAGAGPFPLLVRVYGGPHAQRVQRSWGLTADLRAQHLCGAGFAVLKLDNRGSARRGLAFEGALRWNMGDIEVQDQVDGVRAMVAAGVADPERVGILGWSYGGYMSLMCLARAPETFHAASAGAPVTHWDTYDTHYTERYMGLPQENAEGYRVSSVMAHTDGIEGALQLIHGMNDENVLFRHTARLINALNRARKEYELLLFPDERHMPRDPRDLIYMEERIRDFFLRALCVSE